MNSFASLIDDLELAIKEGAPTKRTAMLRQVTDLFLGGAMKFNDEQIEVFDDILVRLTREIEYNVLAEIGAKLAPIDHAPYELLRSFAHHDEIAVAGPVLTLSTRLSEDDLIEVAKTKGQAHLGAISDRERLATALTDVLVDRGDSGVVRKLARNQGAAFSNGGFARLTDRAETDDTLAEHLAARQDMPLPMLEQLVAKATQTVQARLIALVPPESQAKLQDVLTSASMKTLHDVAAPRDYRHAEALVDKLRDHDQLNEAVVVSFITSHQYEETVVSLARLCAAPRQMIERLMQDPRNSGLLVACKTAGLHWPTFKLILENRFPNYPPSSAELESARSDFLKLSAATAQRMFRFWLIRDKAGD